MASLAAVMVPVKAIISNSWARARVRRRVHGANDKLVFHPHPASPLLVQQQRVILGGVNVQNRAFVLYFYILNGQPQLFHRTPQPFPSGALLQRRDNPVVQHQRMPRPAMVQRPDTGPLLGH